MVAVVDKFFDNSEDNEGKPNYAIDLIDGTRLYCRGEVIHPMPKSGDAINYTEINTKTSSKGNQYTNVKDIQIVPDHTHEADASMGQVMNQSNVSTSQSNSSAASRPMMNGKDATQRRDIFVTGIVGRAMGSGHFAVDDISELTKNAVRSFNDNLERL